jgi:type II secretory pathway component GspD/PulD (secretin)
MRAKMQILLRARTRIPQAALWLAGFPGILFGQNGNPPAQASPVQVASAQGPSANGAQPAKQPAGSDRRRAVKLFLSASKLFEDGKFEEAMHSYQQAAELDPSNTNYPLAAALARNHAVTALIQSAAKDRFRGNTASERSDLARALELDPKNIQVTEHLHELSDDVDRSQTTPRYEQAARSMAEAAPLEHAGGSHSFHLKTNRRQVILQVFNAFGVESTVDASVRATPIRLDVDDASFDQATQILSLATDTFFVPLDSRRVLVALDTPENRRQFLRQELETIYLPGLSAAELTEMGNVAKNVFDMQQPAVDPSAGTLTIRAPEKTLNAFNATMRDILDGRSQVLLQVKVFQLAHTMDRNTGIQPPQSISAFNVYAEEQSILNANQSLVQQIISSGLAAPGDTLAILGILLASGQVSSSLFSKGIALFGGGLTQSALAPGSVTANLNLNSSDSRELDDMQLRLGDGEPGEVRSGIRYPIQTSSFSSLSGSVPSIPGLTGAGNSSSLSSLLSSLSSVPNIPQVEYQDLGMTLKTTANAMRNNEVALTIDMKINALSGTSLNGNPVLNNRAYSGVLTVKQDEGVVLISDLNRQESRAISGVPGLSEIPGLNNATGNETQKDYATLLILITPHVIRGTQSSGHTPMLRIDRSQQQGSQQQAR